jgi:stringent starvation protein B
MKTKFKIFKLLCKLNYLYFKAVLTCRVPVLHTVRSAWNISPEATRGLNMTFKFIRFRCTIGGKVEEIEEPIDEVIAITIEDHDSKYLN